MKIEEKLERFSDIQKSRYAPHQEIMGTRNVRFSRNNRHLMRFRVREVWKNLEQFQRSENKPEVIWTFSNHRDIQIYPELSSKIKWATFGLSNKSYSSITNLYQRVVQRSSCPNTRKKDHCIHTFQFIAFFKLFFEHVQLCHSLVLIYVCVVEINDYLKVLCIILAICRFEEPLNSCNILHLRVFEKNHQ